MILDSAFSFLQIVLRHHASLTKTWSFFSSENLLKCEPDLKLIPNILWIPKRDTQTVLELVNNKIVTIKLDEFIEI